MAMLIIISLGILVGWFVISCPYFRRRQATGESVYLDRGFKTKVLVSKRYGIRAKPDNIETGTGDGLVLIELKNRARAVAYPSDRAQIIASVIAARESGYDVRSAMLEVRNGKRINVKLSDDTATLASMIEKPLEAARTVAQGGAPKAIPAKGKCATCGFRKQCQFKA